MKEQQERTQAILSKFDEVPVTRINCDITDIQEEYEKREADSSSTIDQVSEQQNIPQLGKNEELILQKDFKHRFLPLKRDRIQVPSLAIEGIKSLQTYIETLELQSTMYQNEFNSYQCSWPGRRGNFTTRLKDTFLSHMLYQANPIRSCDIAELRHLEGFEDKILFDKEEFSEHL